MPTLSNLVSVAFSLLMLQSALLANDAMVLTPAGYLPKSKMHALRPGNTLVSPGRLAEFEDAIFPLATGWISDGMWRASEDELISSFRTSWVVPPEPANKGSQTLFYFNGLMNNQQDAILQPVLQWGQSANGGGAYWTVASWYVAKTGTFYSDPIHVTPGTQLTGVMTLSSHAATGFTYTSVFEGIPKTLITVKDIDVLLVASETLEAYGITNCSEYAASNGEFTSISLHTVNPGSKLDWKAEDRVVDCGQQVHVVSNSNTAGEVDILTR